MRTTNEAIETQKLEFRGHMEYCSRYFNATSAKVFAPKLLTSLAPLYGRWKRLRLVVTRDVILDLAVSDSSSDLSDPPPGIIFIAYCSGVVL